MVLSFTPVGGKDKGAVSTNKRTPKFSSCGVEIVVGTAMLRSTGKPAPKIRLSHSEVSTADLHTPGNFSRLLKKLKNSLQSRQIGRGAACQRCKAKKSKCDGSRPCKTCIKANLPCDEACNDVDLQAMELAAQKVDWPVPAPESYIFPSLRMSKAAIPPPLEVGNIMRVGFDYGIPVSKLAAMFSAMPPKLLGALGQLLERLMSAGPPPLDPMPQNSLRCIGNSSSFSGIVVRRSADASCESISFTPSWARASGAHPEEVSARVASKDMPQPLSEYRILCNHLSLLLGTVIHPNGVKQFIWPMLQNHVNQTAMDENWMLIRVSCRPYADGIVSTIVELRPDEYDRAVARAPEARGGFVECDLSGHELANTKDLRHREQFSVMMQTPEGRGKLERLADKIVAAFRLNEEPPPPPGGMPPSLAMGTNISSDTTPTQAPLPHAQPSDCSPSPNERFVSVPHDVARNSPDPSLLAATHSSSLSAIPTNAFPASQPLTSAGNSAMSGPAVAPPSYPSFHPSQAAGLDQPHFSSFPPGWDAQCAFPPTEPYQKLPQHSYAPALDGFQPSAQPVRH